MGHANQRGGRQGRGEYRDAALLRTPRTPDRTAEDYRRLPRLPSRGGRAAAIHQTRSRNCCTWTPAARTAVTRLAGIVRRRGGWRPTERGGLCSAARQGAGVDQSRSVMQSRRQVAAQRVCSPQHITMIVLRLAPRTRRSLAHPVGDTWVCSTSWDAGDGWRDSELQLAANCSRRSAAWSLSTAHLMTPTVCMESSSCDRNCAPLNAPLSTSSAEAAWQASRDPFAQTCRSRDISAIDGDLWSIPPANQRVRGSSPWRRTSTKAQADIAICSWAFVLPAHPLRTPFPSAVVERPMRQSVLPRPRCCQAPSWRSRSLTGATHFS